MVAEFVAGAGAATVVAETAYLTDWFKIGKRARAKRRAKKELLEGIDASYETLRTLARKPEKPPKNFEGFLWRLYGIRVAGIYDSKYRGSENQKQDYKNTHDQMIEGVKTRRLSPDSALCLLPFYERAVGKDF